jgi:outer membrane protein TolC
MRYLVILLVLISQNVFSQESSELTFSEYLGYIKKYHPLAKSANLQINQAQANLMMARGGFDPKIEVDFQQKKFKDKEYYSLLNSSFKIPTWYGIEVRAGFDNNEGIYLNPENTLPNQGLTSVGLSVPLGQGLFINQRMADVRNAKLQINLTKAEQQLQITNLLYNASLAYFNWYRNYSEVKLYENFLENAKIRFEGVKKTIIEGDKPAIDSIEAGIVVKNRKLNLEDSRLKLTKSSLELSNFLWLENNIPFELNSNIIPEKNPLQTIKETLNLNSSLTGEISITNHPKIKALSTKIDILGIEKKLKANLLLPKIDLGYSYLSEPSSFEKYRFQDYKFGLNFYFPLFLRKERGSLNITKFKLQDTKFNFEFEKLQLNNKINALQVEISSLDTQQNIVNDLVTDNQKMLDAEEKLFSFGESSIFILNARENNLINSQLTKINLDNRILNSNAELFKIMANPN